MVKPSKPGWLYIARFEEVEAVKIGFAKDFSRRVREISEQGPFDLKLLAACPVSLRVEKAIHFAFAPLRIRREWYRPSKALDQLVKLSVECELWDEVEAHLFQKGVHWHGNASTVLQQEVANYFRGKGIEV